MAVLLKVAAVSCVLVALVACGGDEPETSSSEAPEAPSVVTGVVIEVSSAGLGRVESFVVKDGDDTYEILIDPEVDYGFNLDHLHEHRATGEPVRVQLKERNGDLYAQSILDA
jgi:hypothetical protein